MLNIATDFVVPDEDEEDVSNKRKRKAPAKTPKKAASKPSPTPITPAPTNTSATTGLTPSAARFAFTPSTNTNFTPRGNLLAKGKPAATPKTTSKKDDGKDDGRYKWLVDVRDGDGNKPGHPEYDSRTLFIPPTAWKHFSPFEKQYWEIKSKHYNQVVFFKKGKFYELYEDDARIGHQQFDLKLTDRVNMSMVGVPESSLEMWSSQFVAKGYPVAKVDQLETALGKEMREKGGKGGGKEDKIIRRELTSILTAGTLVDEAMLQGDMSVYCVSIKASETE